MLQFGLVRRSVARCASTHGTIAGVYNLAKRDRYEASGSGSHGLGRGLTPETSSAADECRTGGGGWKRQPWT